MLAALALGLVISASGTAQSAGPILGADTISRHMAYLTSPELEGRLPLTPGNVRAERYLEAEMRRLRLEPFIGQSFNVPFEIQLLSRPGRTNLLVGLPASGGEVELALGSDWLPVEGTATRLMTEPAVFVGYGIAEPGNSDYDGLSVEGMWAVMVRRDHPQAPQWTLLRRIEAAGRLGAAGVILVGPVHRSGSEIPRPSRTNQIPSEWNLPVAGISTSAFERVTGLRLPDMLRGPLDLEFRGAFEVVPNRGPVNNIVGVIPGTEPRFAAEPIVIGAHFDHLGWGQVASRTGNEILHHGADDNASGVSATLALMEYFASQRTNRRPIVFAFFNAEEVGLLGAFDLTRNHRERFAGSAAMLNLDMVGRLRGSNLGVFGSRSAPEFAAILRAHREPGVRIDTIERLQGIDSDHTPFRLIGVPVMFFHTHLHDEYHTELDTLETVNIQGIALVSRAVRDIVKGIDALEQRPVFNPQAFPGRSPFE